MIRLEKPALVAALRRPHDVIEASAGTGKTYTLERLVADAVLSGTPLERLLVVTYTDKAAQELRHRIRAFLEGLLTGDLPEASPEACAWELDDTAFQRVREALQAFDRASLSTIHGFCRTILQDTALEAGTLFQQDLADERPLFARAFRTCMTGPFTQDPELWSLLQQAQTADWSLEAVEDLLWQAHTDGAVPMPRPGDWAAARAAWSLGTADLPALEEGLRRAKPHHSTLKAALAALPTLVACLEAAPSGSLAFAQAWQGLKLGSLTKACQKVLDTDLEGPVRQLAVGLRALVLAGPTVESVLVHALLDRVQDTLAQLCRTEGLFTFRAMIHDVAAALEGPGGDALARRIGQRYDLALVDEFQDTDPHQWTIFRRLFRETGRLVLIGDPKQAIYGFRGGDLATYESACQDLLEGRAPLRLDRNFRSTPRVIEAYNHILQGLFTREGSYDTPVGCGNPRLRTLLDGEDAPAVDLLEVNTTTGGAKLWRQAARALARHLKELKASGLQFGVPGALRTLGYGDVQVLVGKATEGEQVARALREEGIPVAFYKQKALFRTPEAEEWLDLLRAVARPRDRGRQARAFLTRFFGFSLADLRGLATLPEDHPALALLLEAHALARSGRLAALPTFLLEASGLPGRLLLCQQGLRGLVNFRHLGELLARKAREGMDLDDLVRQLDRWVRGLASAPAEDGDLQRVEGEPDAVQILTLHASKGLEAPIVVPFAFGKGARSSLHRYHEGTERRLHLGPMPGWAEDEDPDLPLNRAAREEDEERQRLLYVGLTRAQARLVLFVFQERRKDDSFKALDGPYEVLNRRLLAMPPCPHLARLDLPWSRLSLLEAPPVPDLATLVPPIIPEAPEVDAEAIRRAARPWITTSFTALHDRGSEALRGDRDQPGLPPPPQDLPRGPHVGQALHELLEWADLPEVAGLDDATWAALPAVQDRVLATLALHGVEARFAPRTAHLVHQALTRPLGPVPPLVEADHLLRELDFQARFREGHPDLLKGSIDALFETCGRAYVLDWKSNHLADYAPATLEACVQASYLLQAKIYTRTTLAFLGIDDPVAYEARFGGILYVFLRGLPGEGVWFHRPTWAEVQQWEHDLAELHAAVTPSVR